MADEAPAVPDIDFERITAEINEEVRRRRASGDFPPGLERELDEVFARYAPVGDTTGGFSEAIEHADTLSYVHADVPLASSIPVVSYVKLVLRKVLGWYVRFLAQQTTSFGTAIVRAVRLLGDRVETLERAVPAADPELAAEVRKLAGPPQLAPWTEPLAETFRGVGGRVLHAECGDGSAVAAMNAVGVDAYGIEPDSDLAVASSQRGLDVRCDDALEHLRGLRDGVLGGLVLSGCVDRFPVTMQRELASLAGAKVRPGGTVAVVGTTPARWERDRSAVAADLAAGRPLHADTWQHLLVLNGFDDARTQYAAVEGDGDGPGALRPVPKNVGGSAVHNENIERLNRVLFEPPSYLVVARRVDAS